MCVVGCFLAIVACIGMRGSHLISFDLLLYYFWGIILFIVPLVLSLFACFNYNFYTKIWFRHSWDSPNFKQIRKIFCPSHTAETLCIAPPDFNSTSDTDYTQKYSQWCHTQYNTTVCSNVRGQAIQRATDWGFTIITVQSFMGVVDLLIIGWSIYLCHQLLTASVITQSMLDVINYLLILPIAACIALTVNFWWIQSLDIKQNWFPRIFLALAVAQVIALPLGIVAGKLKSRRMLWVYVALMLMIATAFAFGAVLEWTLATIVVTTYVPPK
jgi:hypothetical protein